jgi:hypothetical protein
VNILWGSTEYMPNNGNLFDVCCDLDILYWFMTTSFHVLSNSLLSKSLYYLIRHSSFSMYM